MNPGNRKASRVHLFVAVALTLLTDPMELPTLTNALQLAKAVNLAVFTETAIDPWSVFSEAV